METWRGILPSFLAVALAGVAPACESHLSRVQVAMVPVDQFQPTPVAAETSVAAQAPPIVENDTSTPAPVTAGPASAPAVATPASGPRPAGPESLDPADEKIKVATKLMNSGRRSELLTARKMLIADVGAGVGTQAEVRLLLRVCAKLGDKGCIQKANSYVK